MRGNFNSHPTQESSRPETCIPVGTLLSDFKRFGLTFPDFKNQRSGRHLPEAKVINPQHTVRLGPAGRGAEQRAGPFLPSCLCPGPTVRTRREGLAGWLSWYPAPPGSWRVGRGAVATPPRPSSGAGLERCPAPTSSFSPPLPHALFHRPRSRKRRGRRVGKCCSVERGGRRGRKKKEKGTETWRSAVGVAVRWAAPRRPAAPTAGLGLAEAPAGISTRRRYPSLHAAPLETQPVRRRRRRSDRGGGCGGGRGS